ALRLAPADVQDDIAEDPVRERLRLAPVDDGELLQLVGALAQVRQALLEVVPETGRQPPPLLQRLVQSESPQLARRADSASGDVGEKALLGEPCVEVHDAAQRAAAVV